MKQITIITLLLIFLSFGLSAQTNPITKSNAKNALDIEITDISGTIHKGKLWYVDSSRIVISDNLYGGDTLELLTPDQIYSIKTLKRANFAKTAVISGALITTVATVATAATCDACMVGPGFIFAVSAFVYGIIPGTVTGLVFNKIPVKKIEYNTNSSDSAYHIVVESMKKHVKNVHDYTHADKSIIIKNQNKLDKIPLPKKRLHPYSSKKVHFEISGDIPLLNPLGELENIFESNDMIFSESYLRQARFSGKLGINLTKHLQLFAGYSYGGAYKSFAEAYTEIDTFEISDYVILEHELQSGTLGFNYIFNPVNNLLTNKFQFDAGISLTMYKIDCFTEIYSLNEYEIGDHAIYSSPIKNTYYSSGININANVKYFVHKNISLNSGFYYDILNDSRAETVTATSVSGRNLSMNSHNLNFSSLLIKFGIEFHF